MTALQLYIRLVARVRFSPWGCWEWTGKRGARGYGYYRKVRVHRLSYWLEYGELPASLVVRHKCDNPICVRPDHLELGTQADNVHDMLRKGRGKCSRLAARTHCKYGHEFTPENTMPIVKKGQVTNGRQCRICKRRDYKKVNARRKAERRSR